MRYEFDPADARKFAEVVGIHSYQKGNELTFKYCPYCKGSEKDKKTFSINMDTGVFQCFRSSCGVKGNMIRLAKDFGFKLSDGYDPGARNTHAIFWQKFKKREPKPKAVEYLESRGISRAITEKYSITCHKDNENILVFPFVDERGMLQMIKYRNIDPKRTGSKEWSHKGGVSILFGMDQCNMDNKTLIITEGQIDSLSVAECGFENAVSVPTGKNGFTWYPTCFDFMYNFTEFIVFGDNEHGTITLLEELYNRLKRTGSVKHVRPEDYQECKDANELLMKKGKDAVIYAIQHAVPVKNKRIKEVADIVAENLDDKPKFSTGIKALDNVLGGGFCFKDLVILTGARGDGKSTMGSQFITHALNQGHKCYVYSGELPDSEFKNWVDRQIVGPRHCRLKKEDYYVDPADSARLSAWMRHKFYLTTEDGDINDDEDQQSIMEILESAVYQYGCKVIMIDNLMTALDDDASSDLYRQQSKFIKNLVAFAKITETVIILIAHPRKDSGKDFSLDSIAGSGNIPNLAHIALRYFRPEVKQGEDPPCDRQISVLKNRHNGKTHKGIDLYYDEASKRISERVNDFDWSIEWGDVDHGFVPAEPDDVPDEIPF